LVDFKALRFKPVLNASVFGDDVEKSLALQSSTSGLGSLTSFSHSRLSNILWLEDFHKLGWVPFVAKECAQLRNTPISTATAADEQS
jgi:hypothetical protein